MFGPEQGHFALALACVLALIQFVVPLWGAHKRNARLVALAPFLAVSQLLALAISFFSLIMCAVHDDFSVQNVAANSAASKPLLYKITGVWGNHEGSVLLWTLILGVCGAAVAAFGRNLPDILRGRVLAVLGGVSAGFQLFCLLTSNPFDRVFPAPMDGQGMNPLLQDPGLAFHPPILYTGYVGFAVPFAFAVAALLEGRVDAAWGRWVRPWAVAAWCFLTCGIALGSWWSYYVLGWGGYWFWDPVENASLIPWLTGTALVHSAIVVEKREGLKIWTVLLAIATFSFSLSGTFLVRSGILNSVHAFANDPARGVFILGLLALVIGGSLALFAWRAPSLTSGGLFSPVSREGSLVLNNILLCSICAVVVTGTMYPPFMQLLASRTISVGKPFFDAATIPLTIPLLLAMGVGTALPWKRAQLARTFSHLFVAAIIAAIGLVLCFWKFSGALPIACGALAIWVMAASVTDILRRVGLGHSSMGEMLGRARNLPRSSWGAALAHIGAGITVLGLCGMSGAQHAIVEIHVGETRSLAGDDWTLLNVHDYAGPNYRAMQADIAIRHNGRLITTLHPEKRDFTTQNQTTTEVAIHTNFITDLYGVVGDRHGTGADATYVLRLHRNPLAPWMWLGGLVMAIGGAFSLSDRRLRVGAPKRAAARNMAQA
ncbi:heme lyase CcmF/NrfE family subunit [Gluconobacter japonicus]|uniref:heme lyase CcmF/NrfE family subunit n=1 Tax=Gluconobacter japonicus TaxID=376620 RepID=UPI001B8AFEB3|nr:heme lyase CcmF/NrfE family subunit [Gluconobacter japonicus]MBS1049434.1 heme lyase CcmF/NrfE family subunit [Gluconobacter japonicus]